MYAVYFSQTELTKITRPFRRTVEADHYLAAAVKCLEQLGEAGFLRLERRLAEGTERDQARLKAYVYDVERDVQKSGLPFKTKIISLEF